MSIELISFILFLLILGIFLYIKRKKISIEKIAYPLFYLIMYRTKIGLKAMDWLAKKQKRLMTVFGYIGIVLGFIGMIFLSYNLIYNLIRLFIEPAASTGVALVLPIKVKGAFYVPFFYWIISIICLAIIHEFSHGVQARLAGIKIKSSGFAFMSILLPIIPAAFVEPDEKQVKKKSLRQQLSIFAAGAFGNFFLAGVVLLMSMLISAPLADATLVFEGVQIHDFVKGEGNQTFGLEESGVNKGEIIIGMDNSEIQTLGNLTLFLRDKKPNETVVVKTNNGTYDVVLKQSPTNTSKAFMGVAPAQSIKVNESFKKKYGGFITNAILWFNGGPNHVGLIYWLIILNLGIGLFNLIPLGPIDGGRMLYAVLLKYMKKDKATRIFSKVSLFFLILVLANIVMGFIR